MKLIDLIPYLENEDALEELYENENLNRDSESVLAYMKMELKIDSDIHFFDMEKTDDECEVEFDGIKFIQLFSLDLGVEFYSYFELEFREKKYSNEQKAKRLLEYIINDA